MRRGQPDVAHAVLVQRQPDVEFEQQHLVQFERCFEQLLEQLDLFKQQFVERVQLQQLLEQLDFEQFREPPPV